MTKQLTAVDLFAGLGGNTEGAAQAGVRVLRAANHWPEAVRVHQLNHPEAEHDVQDLQQCDFHKWPDFDVMMASPACQGFSVARGTDAPRHDVCRSTAWAVIACAEAKKPKALMVENVVEFTRWKLFPAWRACLETLGYVLHVNTLDAADFGVPQNRVRAFITGVRRDVSAEPVVVRSPALPHAPAANIIDWEGGSWSPVNRPGRSPATLERVANGRSRLGERFLAPFYGSGSGKTGRSLDRPLGTVTTKDRWMLVDGDRCRMLIPAESRRAMGFGDHYALPASNKVALHLLGNAVVPAVAKAVLGALCAPLLN